MASIHAQVAVIIAILMLCSTHIDAGKKWNDVNNCGRKGLKCPCLPRNSNTRSTCVDGKCGFACKDGWRDCDNDILAADGTTSNGCETNVRRDARNCGQCGTVCPAYKGSTARCLKGGQCGFTCNKGYQLQTDTNTCVSTKVATSTCGTSCKSPGPNTDAVCVGGTCKPVCRQGFENCDADAGGICEVNVKEDLQHCGSCNHRCPQRMYKSRRLLANDGDFDIATCSNGTCGTACGLQGTADCDGNGANGCEVNLLGDSRNCGACGKFCGELSNSVGVSCSNGKCGYSKCVEGFADCDGDIRNGCEHFPTVENGCSECGGTGPPCAAPNNTVAAACKGNVCSYTKCLEGFADCDEDASNGCEVDLRFVNETLCGSCAQVCPGWAHLNKVSSCTWEDDECFVDKCVQSGDPVGDCDGDIRNGCEQVTALPSPETGCYGCGLTGLPCAVPNNTVAAACKGNVCSYTKCEEGFRDCDTLLSNGCEVDTRVTGWEYATEYCGACFHDEKCNGDPSGCTSQCTVNPWVDYCDQPSRGDPTQKSGMTLCRHT